MRKKKPSTTATAPRILVLDDAPAVPRALKLMFGDRPETAPSVPPALAAQGCATMNLYGATLGSAHLPTFEAVVDLEVLPGATRKAEPIAIVIVRLTDGTYRKYVSGTDSHGTPVARPRVFDPKLED